MDTFSLSIPLVNGCVGEGAAASAYLTIGEWADGYNVEGSSHLAIIDLVAISTSNVLDLHAVVVVGSGYDRGVPNTSYNPNDYWNWMSMGIPNQCGCDPSSPTFGNCADMQIQQRINFAINGGYYQYWTDVESWWVNHWGYDDPSENVVGLLDHPSPIGPDNLVFGDDVRDYPVFRNNSGDGCFSPTDMRFYTQGAWDLMQTVRTTYVPTKQVASCTIQGDMALGGSNSWFQWATFRYGKLSKHH